MAESYESLLAQRNAICDENMKDMFLLLKTRNRIVSMQPFSTADITYSPSETFTNLGNCQRDRILLVGESILSQNNEI